MLSGSVCPRWRQPIIGAATLVVVVLFLPGCKSKTAREAGPVARPENAHLLGEKRGLRKENAFENRRFLASPVLRVEGTILGWFQNSQ